MSRHKVRTHLWIGGILHVEELMFDSITEAMDHVSHGRHHGAKITDEQGQVVYTVGNIGSTEAYA